MQGHGISWFLSQPVVPGPVDDNAKTVAEWLRKLTIHERRGTRSAVCGDRGGRDVLHPRSARNEPGNGGLNVYTVC